MSFPRAISPRAVLIFAVLTGMLCGCKTRTITYTRKEDPLLEKYASNFSIVEGRATSDKRSAYDARQYSGNRGFQAGKFKAREFPRTDYAGTAEFSGVEQFAGTDEREVTPGDSSLGKKRFWFGRKKPRENSQNFRSEAFPVSSYPGGEKSVSTRPAPVAAGAQENAAVPDILQDRGREMTVEEVRALLNRN